MKRPSPWINARHLLANVRVSVELYITLRVLRNFKMFEISGSELGTVGMLRHTAVTEGVVHSVYNVIWSSFGVIRRHKVG